MLDNHKQTSWSSQPISYVEDSHKLFKGRVVKPRRHALGLDSPSTLQEEVLDTVILAETTLVFRKYFIKKLSYLDINKSFKNFRQIGQYTEWLIVIFF